jgi:hypothetical protein
MSPPETNPETEARRHRPALYGIVFAVAAALIAGAVIIVLPRLPAEEQASPVPEPDAPQGEIGE